jgi:uncharacterized protein YwgA
MEADEVVILTLKYSDAMMIAGRTLLQKTLYFLNEKLSLGLDFTPYYYGPYSSEVAEVTSSLKAAGLLDERVETFPAFNFSVTFEPRRYTYRLTDIGKEFADLLVARDEERATEIKTILGKMKEQGAANDYKNLSIAAKMDQILKIEDKKMTAEEILKEAKSIGWNIEEEEALSAINFLDEMKLIEIERQSKV